MLLGQPILQLLSPTPPPPALSKKCTGGCATHQSGLPTFKALPGGAPLALGGLPAVLQVTVSLRLLSPTEADPAASAFGTGSLRLLKAIALHL